MSADRNLLFGVLALQADLLDTSRFAEACSAWAGRKDTSLADLLVERGWLTPEDRTDVDRLLEPKLKKHNGDAHASLLAATTAEARRILAGVADPAVAGIDHRPSVARRTAPVTRKPLSLANDQSSSIPRSRNIEPSWSQSAWIRRRQRRVWANMRRPPRRSRPF
jgi:hypothetical protein